MSINGVRNYQLLKLEKQLMSLKQKEKQFEHLKDKMKQLQNKSRNLAKAQQQAQIISKRKDIDNQQQIQQLRQQIDYYIKQTRKIQQTRRTIKQQLHSAHSQQQQLLDTLEQLKSTNDMKNKQISNIQMSIKEKLHTIDSLENQYRSRQANIEKMKKDIIQYQYEIGEHDKQLLTIQAKKQQQVDFRQRLRHKINQLQTQLTQTKQQITQQQQTIHIKKQQRDDILTVLQQICLEEQAYQKQIADKNSELEIMIQRSEGLQKRIKILKNQLDSIKLEMKTMEEDYEQNFQQLTIEEEENYSLNCQFDKAAIQAYGLWSQLKDCITDNDTEQARRILQIWKQVEGIIESVDN